MQPASSLEFAVKTHPGLVRSHNEDAVVLSPDFGFAVLADGMGGYSAGEIASAIASDVTKLELENGLKQLQNQPFRMLPGRAEQIHALMLASIQQANTAILEAVQAEPRYRGMGTTLVAALFSEDRVTIAHVGDSRAYRLRNEELVQITRDHSLLQEQIDAGLITVEQARFSLQKNLVTRAVGVGPELEVEIHDYQTRQGDLYLMCSDGLSDMLSTEEIKAVVSDSALTLDDACDVLVQKANDNGGDDNISVILVKLQSGGSGTVGFLGRILSWVA